MLKKLIIIFLAGMVLSVLVFLGLYSKLQNQTRPQTTFSILHQDALPTTLSLEELRGKVVLVKFWATNCSTCIEQMPHTNQLYNQYQEQGLEVIAVAMHYDALTYVKNFQKYHPQSFLIAYDATGENSQAFNDVRFTPTTFVLDKEGKIVEHLLGRYDYAKLNQIIQDAINE